MKYPLIRGRRLRSSAGMRRLVGDVRVCKDDLVMPVFVRAGKKICREITSMPGIFQFSPDTLLKEIEKISDLGISAVIVFGIPEEKDEQGSGAFSEQGIVQQAVRLIKADFPDLLVITDVCLCEYTSHGHCGVLTEDREVDNDATLELLSKTALSQAESGADMVAPSSMMDGQVKAIRSGLDSSGFARIPIMSYSAKYASAFYGPFRDAADSAPGFGDRRSYQMDCCRTREGLREIELDLKEGADIVMVKPALCYLDIISQARQKFSAPLAAYNVSGEYSMVKAAGAKGWIPEQIMVQEILCGLKRAGADILITYHAKEAALWLQQGNW